MKKSHRQIENVMELLPPGEQVTIEELHRRDRARTIAERQHRRLVAPDLDTTGDWVDPRLADNPLLAWCQ